MRKEESAVLLLATQVTAFTMNHIKPTGPQYVKS